MRQMMRFLLAILIAGGSAGCTAITFSSPSNGSTQPQTGSNPIQVAVVELGVPDHVVYKGLILDSLDLSSLGGQRQLVPQSRLSYVPAGAHSLFLSATDTYGIGVNAATSFTVANCPLCYACPVGSTVDPVFGQCCDSGKCDTVLSANFGIWRYNTAECQKPVTATSLFFSDLDCISPGTVILSGTGMATGGVTAPKAAAVMFSSTQGGTLRQIQVPVGWTGNNPAPLTIWITNDAGGHPGTTVLESWTGLSVRPQPTSLNSVVSPVHVFSAAHPLLAANTNYWLVIAAPSAQWNFAQNQADSSLPGAPTYLWNTMNAGISGPWTADPNQLPQLRPAFEIDVRQ